MPILQSTFHSILLAARRIEDIYLAQAATATAAIHELHSGLITGDQFIAKLESLFSDPLRTIGLEHGEIEVELTKYRMTHRKNEVNRERKRQSRANLSVGNRRISEHSKGKINKREEKGFDPMTQKMILEAKGLAPDDEIQMNIFSSPSATSPDESPLASMTLAAKAKMTPDDLLYLQRDIENAMTHGEDRGRGKLKPGAIAPDGTELI